MTNVTPEAKPRAIHEPSEVTVFGLPDHTGRWLFVFVGLIINICLGTVYAWSVFRGPIARQFSTAEIPITAKQTLWPFMLFLAVFTALMPIAGRIIQKVHPRILSLVGSVIVCAGWILSSYASDMNFLYVTYGIIAGAGVGIVYGIPIAVTTRWFPDLKGLAVGITVSGFGVSALVTAPLAQALIQNNGVLSTFFTLGVAFLVMLVPLSLVLRFPPEGWQPENWKGAAAAAKEQDFTTAEMVRTPAGLGLWLCYIIGALSGLMSIGISSSVAQEIIRLDAVTAAGLVSFFAVFNGAGRPIFGWLTDAIGPSRAAALSFLLILLASLGMLLAGEGNVLLYAVCFCAFWMALGAWLAIAPTTTAIFFGRRNYAANYGVVFSAYGIGAIGGGLIAGSAKDIFGSYLFAFWVTGALAAVGIIVALALLKKPRVA